MINYRHCTTSEASVQNIIHQYMFTTHPKVIEHYKIEYDVQQMYDDDIGHPEKYEKPTGSLYMAEESGEIIGLGGLSLINKTEAELKRFFVKPNHRKRGIASTILTQLLADAKSMGFKAIKLESARFMTEAHGLYKKFGFHESTMYDEAVSQKGFEHAIVYMKITL